MYTYDDAAKALRMIFHGLLLLALCMASAVLTVIGSLLTAIVHNPLHALLVAAGCVLAALFVPSLVALAWLIC